MPQIPSQGMLTGLKDKFRKFYPIDLTIIRMTQVGVLRVTYDKGKIKFFEDKPYLHLFSNKQDYPAPDPSASMITGNGAETYLCYMPSEDELLYVDVKKIRVSELFAQVEKDLKEGNPEAIEKSLGSLKKWVEKPVWIEPIMSNAVKVSYAKLQGAKYSYLYSGSKNTGLIAQAFVWGLFLVFTVVMVWMVFNQQKEVIAKMPEYISECAKAGIINLPKPPI